LATGHPGIGTKLSEQAALTARLMLYGLLAVVLMAMDHRGQYIPRLRSIANQLVEPVYHLVDWPVSALRSVFGFLQSGQTLRRENQQLKAELLEQRGALQRLQALSGENQRLRTLLESTESHRFSYRFAELVEVDLDPFSHRVMIDRGSSNGVQVGQAVIDGAGVMGQVESVSAHFAAVRLISDPNHALPVQFNRTGLRSVAFGLGTTAYLSLPTVPLQADVREGDLIVTSGLGDRFPAGYPVAKVASVDRREGQTFMQVLAAPLAALDRGREVLLIVPVAAPQDGSAELQQAEPDAGEPSDEQPDIGGGAGTSTGEQPEADGGADRAPGPPPDTAGEP
jgi:rod shape-determining protein MreC